MAFISNIYLLFFLHSNTEFREKHIFHNMHSLIPTPVLRDTALNKTKFLSLWNFHSS